MAWLAATEKRVKSTMAMIATFKEMKMLGIAPEYLKNIQDLRIIEVNLGRYAVGTLGNSPSRG